MPVAYGVYARNLRLLIQHPALADETHRPDREFLLEILSDVEHRRRLPNELALVSIAEIRAAACCRDRENVSEATRS